MVSTEKCVVECCIRLSHTNYLTECEQMPFGCYRCTHCTVTSKFMSDEFNIVCKIAAIRCVLSSVFDRKFFFVFRCVHVFVWIKRKQCQCAREKQIKARVGGGLVRWMFDKSCVSHNNLIKAQMEFFLSFFYSELRGNGNSWLMHNNNHSLDKLWTTIGLRLTHYNDRIDRWTKRRRSLWNALHLVMISVTYGFDLTFCYDFLVCLIFCSSLGMDFLFRMNGQCTSAEWFVFPVAIGRRRIIPSSFFCASKFLLILDMILLLFCYSCSYWPFMSSGLRLRCTRLSIVKWKDTFLCFATKERHQNNSFYMCKNNCSTTNKRLAGLAV